MKYLSRQLHDPYVIKNMTGYKMHIWIESKGDGLDTVIQEIQNGEERPWGFNDWKSMREV